jgi:excisionase family DNA binding protein
VGKFKCNWFQLQLGGKRIDSFSVEKFAKMLDISQRTAYGLIASGLGPSFIRVGRHIRITQEDLDKWIETKRSDK